MKIMPCQNVKLTNNFYNFCLRCFLFEIYIKLFTKMENSSRLELFGSPWLFWKKKHDQFCIHLSRRGQIEAWNFKIMEKPRKNVLQKRPITSTIVALSAYSDIKHNYHGARHKTRLAAWNNKQCGTCLNK